MAPPAGAGRGLRGGRWPGPPPPPPPRSRLAPAPLCGHRPGASSAAAILGRREASTMSRGPGRTTRRARAGGSRREKATRARYPARRAARAPPAAPPRGLARKHARTHARTSSAALGRPRGCGVGSRGDPAELGPGFEPCRGEGATGLAGRPQTFQMWSGGIFQMRLIFKSVDRVQEVVPLTTAAIVRVGLVLSVEGLDMQKREVL